MIENIRRARLAFEFINRRVPEYVQLAQYEFVDFRLDLIKALVSCGLLAGAGLLFISFLSVAVIVSAWDTDHRVLAAWGVCGVWGLLALIGLLIGRSVAIGPVPFKHLAQELSKDISTVRGDA